MPKIHVSKSVLIDAPLDKVYSELNHFKNWNTWSPWLILEEGVKLDIAEDGKYYEWQGKRVGSGNMKITEEKQNEWVDYDLNFLTPWKSYAKVRFEVKPEGNGTKASWIMDSSLPFFMFWMTKMMTAFIGMDFERGLNMLKNFVEEGKVNSKLEFKGDSSYSGCTYIGIKNSCSIDDLSKVMHDDFTKLGEVAKKHSDLITPPPFSIYHKWDMVKGKASYTSGIPVSKLPDRLPDGMISGKIDATKIHTVKHTGPYLHLGNAWSSLYSMQRGKEFKMNKKVDPFEIYVTEPGKVPDNELVTEVNFAIK